MENLTAGKNAILYTTTRSIINPIGDGRHNRAPWRSALEKSTVPAGFVFAIDEDGNIEDRSRPLARLEGDKAAALRAHLLAVASEPMPPVSPEETIEEVLESVPGGNAKAVPAVLKALGITPQQLRSLLQGPLPAPSESEAPAVPSHQ